VSIREATVDDFESIRNVHLDAFGKVDGAVVSKLAVDLLTDETAKPLLSLVADAESRIIGSIIFTTVRVQGREGKITYILAPLAVARDFQRKGIGRALIEHGLQMLSGKGADLVFVLGDPNYYGRYGFSHNHRVLPPYQLGYPRAWMALELKRGALEAVSGQIACANALSAPEHW
jgi:predicted N-acetyltransferase YhbS